MPFLVRLMFVFILSCLFVPFLHAESASDTWLLSIDRWGNPEYRTATLVRSGDRVDGDLGGWPLTGHREDDRL